MPNILFWTFVDPIIGEFVKANKQFQRIADLHDCIFLCSEESDKELIKDLYGDHKCLITKNNLQLKGKELLEHVENVDALIKLDLDAVVMSYDWLLKEIEDALEGDDGLYGNMKHDPTQTYIRGAFNILTGDLINTTRIEIDETVPCGVMNFDYVYSRAVGEENLKDRKLFELNGFYQGKAPVWHPPKRANKLKLLKKHIKKTNIV